MSSLPLPFRVAAGLAAIAVEQTRRLPHDVSEWPMAAVSQALQVSMRVQQRITELAIKGDEAIAALREAPEDPPWAVFDEDLPQPSYLRPEAAQEAEAPAARAPAFDDEVDGYDLGGPAPAETAETADTPVQNGGHAAGVAAGGGGGAPGALPSYPGLSLASVRGRLRALAVEDLEELLEYERGHADRAEFVRLLTNRIATVRNR